MVLQKKETDFDWQDPLKSPLKKKVLKEPKLGGVRKIIVLFMGECIPENYFNVNLILEALDLQNNGSLSYTFSSDFKLGMFKNYDKL